jgi:hypothetical protein
MFYKYLDSILKLPKEMSVSICELMRVSRSAGTMAVTCQSHLCIKPNTYTLVSKPTYSISSFPLTAGSIHYFPIPANSYTVLVSTLDFSHIFNESTVLESLVGDT